MTNLAVAGTAHSDVTVMQGGRASDTMITVAIPDTRRGRSVRTGLNAMAQPVLDRLVVVFIGAILIALGAFAISDPSAVRARLSSIPPLSRVPVSDDHVRAVGAAVILIAAIVVVGALLALRAAPQAR